MFTPSATYYDALYTTLGKNYQQEAERLRGLIQQYLRSSGKTLLDVACGTGGHLQYLQQWFTSEGLDLDENLLQLARKKLPNTIFHRGDMLDFDLHRRFDVVTCLFSSIGYAATKAKLHQAIRNLQRHVLPRGLLIIEPWLTPEQYLSGVVHATFVNQPQLKIARMNVSETSDGNKSILNFHYLVGTPDGVQHFTEHHELGLFTHSEYLEAFVASGIEPIYDESGLEGRGLYLGINSMD